VLSGGDNGVITQILKILLENVQISKWSSQSLNQKYEFDLDKMESHQFTLLHLVKFIISTS